MASVSNATVKVEPDDDEVSNNATVKVEPDGEEDEVLKLRKKVEELNKRLFLIEDFVQVEFPDHDEKLSTFSQRRDRLIELGYGESLTNVLEGTRGEKSKEIVYLLRFAKNREGNATSTSTETNASHPSPAASGSSDPSSTNNKPSLITEKPRGKRANMRWLKHLVKCPLCPQLLIRKNIREHLIVIHQNQPSKCPICSSVVGTKEALKFHLVNEHQLVCNSPEYFKIWNSACKAFTDISKQFKSWTLPLMANAQRATQQDFKGYQEHLIEGDGAEEALPSGSEDDVDSEDETKTGESDSGIKNEPDPTIKTDPDAVPDHKYWQTRLNKCPLCPRVISREYIREHVVVVHKNQLFKCTICSATFETREALGSHLVDLHQLTKTSPSYIGVMESAEQNLSVSMFQFKQWIKSIVRTAKPPTQKEIEEYMRYEKERTNKMGNGKSGSNVSAGSYITKSKEPVHGVVKEHGSAAANTSSESTTSHHRHPTQPPPSTATTSSNSGPPSNKKRPAEEPHGSGPQKRQKFLDKGKVPVRKGWNKKLNKCPVCPVVISRKFLIEHLIVVHHNQPFRCTICNAAHDSREGLKLHLVDDHHLERSSYEYTQVMLDANNAFLAAKPRFKNQVAKFFDNAKPPTEEELEAHQRKEEEEANRRYKEGKGAVSSGEDYADD